MSNYIYLMKKNVLKFIVIIGSFMTIGILLQLNYAYDNRDSSNILFKIIISIFVSIILGIIYLIIIRLINEKITIIADDEIYGYIFIIHLPFYLLWTYVLHLQLTGVGPLNKYLVLFVCFVFIILFFKTSRNIYKINGFKPEIQRMINNFRTYIKLEYSAIKCFLKIKKPVLNMNDLQLLTIKKEINNLIDKCESKAKSIKLLFFADQLDDTLLLIEQLQLNLINLCFMVYNNNISENLRIALNRIHLIPDDTIRNYINNNFIILNKNKIGKKEINSIIKNNNIILKNILLVFNDLKMNKLYTDLDVYEKKIKYIFLLLLVLCIIVIMIII